MSRYEVIQTDENQYFFYGSKLLLLKSALTRDSEADSVLLQLKMSSRYQETIASITVEILCFDLEGTSLGVKEFQFLDLSIHKNDIFADRIPIYLDNNKTRKYQVFLKKIIFEGNISKTFDEGNCSIIPNNAFPLEGDLKEQFVRNIKAPGVDVKTQCNPELFDVFWKCSCGYINSIDDNKCVNCGCDKEILEANLDIDKLTEDLQIFQANQEKQAAEKKEAQKN